MCISDISDYYLVTVTDNGLVIVFENNVLLITFLITSSLLIYLLN